MPSSVASQLNVKPNDSQAADEGIIIEIREVGGLHHRETCIAFRSGMRVYCVPEST